MSETLNRQNLMTEGGFRKKILFFAGPIFIGQLFQQLYNTADSLIVGQFLGKEALAAVSSTGSLTYLLIGFFMGFSTGAGIVIARWIGAEDEQRASKAVHTAVAMGLMFSVILSVAGVLFCPVFLKWMGSPEDVLPLSSLYLRVYFGGSTGLIMYNTFVGILQASGDSKHPLIYLIISSITNVILDIFFIGVLKFGVEGAAIATVISQFLSMFLVLARLRKTEGATKIELRKISLDPGNFKQIVRYGLPTALQACVIDLSNILIQSYINSFGKLAMAGIGAYSKVEGFAFLPTNAFSMAMSTYVSQNMGAKKYDRVKAGIRFGILSAISMVALIGLTIYLFAPVFIAAFNSDPEVVAYGVARARICAPFYFLLSFSHVTSAIMRGVGKPLAPMIVMLVCWCAVRVAVLMTVGQTYHFIDLTSWLYPITWSMSTIVYLFYLRNIRYDS